MTRAPITGVLLTFDTALTFAPSSIKRFTTANLLNATALHRAVTTSLLSMIEDTPSPSKSAPHSSARNSTISTFPFRAEMNNGAWTDLLHGQSGTARYVLLLYSCKISVKFRPISVTPLLSRLLEKIVVSKFLYPALIHPKCEQLFRDQFAFRPTGSTTSALISLIHHVSSLLQNYPYVHVFALDFSKAFDTVRHSTLASKCADLPIEDEVHNWVLEFLDDRVHCTKFGGIISAERRINASIVQGSGIGPVSYVICASDLRALHTGNAFDNNNNNNNELL